MFPQNPIIQYLRTILGDNKVFLVGGLVRDFLLGREIKDCDLMMEGDVFSLAVLLTDRFGCNASVNKLWLTVTLSTAWGTLDIARARREVYEYPGALPAVYSATWKEDLKRRDFTINTLAVPLLEEGWGEVVDLLGGVEDLRNGLIRILHEKSFRDDPTRLLRAVRLKNRLDFRFEDMTLACLKRDWDCLKLVSPVRRFKEWQLICEEKKAGDILDDIYHLGGWKAFLGNIPYHSGIIGRISALPVPGEPEGFRRWFWCMLFLLDQSPGNLSFLIDYWGLSKKDSEGITVVLNVNKDLNKVKSLPKRQIYRLMKELPVEGVYYLFINGLSYRFTWEQFYREMLSTQMPLKGQDLLEIGFKPGPGLGHLLRRLEDSYWKGEFDTVEEGLKIIKQVMKEDINV